jgi:RNA polymerase sigma-70 factor, ECF subfamily
MRDLTDAELAVRSSRGEYAAFEELIRRRRGSLAALIRRLARDPNDTEDLLQETLIRSWVNIAAVRDPERIHAWLLQVARNCCRDHDRLAARREQPTDQQALESYLNRYGRTGQPSRATADLGEALSSLPQAELEAVRLFYLHGWAIAEVASLTQSPVGTVKSRLFNARHHLRAFFDSNEHKGDEE